MKYNILFIALGFLSFTSCSNAPLETELETESWNEWNGHAILNWESTARPKGFDSDWKFEFEKGDSFLVKTNISISPHDFVRLIYGIGWREKFVYKIQSDGSIGKGAEIPTQKGLGYFFGHSFMLNADSCRWFYSTPYAWYLDWGKQPYSYDTATNSIFFGEKRIGQIWSVTEDALTIIVPYRTWNNSLYKNPGFIIPFHAVVICERIDPQDENSRWLFNVMDDSEFKEFIRRNTVQT